MRTITLHTIHAGARENYTKSNKKNVNRTLIGNRGHGKNKIINVTVIFTNIRTSRSTYYLLYDKCHSKTNTTIIPYSILLQILASQAKK